MDCDNEEEFDTVLAGLEPLWDEREMAGNGLYKNKGSKVFQMVQCLSRTKCEVLHVNQI